MSNISIVAQKDCTGCGACFNKCPKEAITMEYNDEGFQFPIVNDRCIDCGLCVQVCPVLNMNVIDRKRSDNSECYAMMADNALRKESSSGGMFTLIARFILSNGGIVFGASFQNNYRNVGHVAIENEAELTTIRGSKYLQSDTGTTYQQVQAALQRGRWVLYSGCPCQIAGLRLFLAKDYDKLLLIDIVCHGVPSPGAYQKYLEEMSGGRKITRVDFREKAYWHWGTASSIFFSNGSIYRKDCYSDPFWKGFIGGVFTRHCCGRCPYANMKRIGDFTLGDFWGVKEIDPNLDDREGTSLVLVNTSKARSLLSKIVRSSTVFQKIDKARVCELAKTRNGQLLHPTPTSWAHEKFFQTLKSEPFSQAFDKSTKKYDVGYVGWWDSTNYGSTLTSYAMNRTLRNMGKSVLMLEYPKQPRHLPHGKRFGAEFAEHFFDECFVTPDAKFDRYNNMCDTFVVGSDQLWNYHANSYSTPTYFFLDFADGKHKKIAFATSFGGDFDSYPQELKIKVGYYLHRFDSVSVREKSGVELCARAFNIDVDHVLDPVFLCQPSDYDEIENLSQISTPSDYVISYILDPTVEKIEMVRLIARELKKPYLIMVDGIGSFSEKQKLVDDDHIVFDLRIEDWIKYIRKSSYVVTDSFHGFCFSMIFHKPMVAIPNAHRGKARFDSIAQIAGLESRMVNSLQECQDRRMWDASIDFTSVDEKIANFKEYSLNWLADALAKPKQKPTLKEMELWKIIEHDNMLYGATKSLKELVERIEQLEARLPSNMNWLNVNTVASAQQPRRKTASIQKGMRSLISRAFGFAARCLRRLRCDGSRIKAKVIRKKTNKEGKYHASNNSKNQ